VAVPKVALAVLTACLGWSTVALAQGAAPPAFLAEARTLIAKGDLPQAQGVLEAGLKANPAAVEAHFLLGFVYFRQNKPGPSLAEFTAGAASRDPTAAEFRIVGADYVLLAAYPEADRWFTKATEVAPNDPEGWYLLGRTKYNEAKYTEALDDFQRALTLKPGDVKAEDNLGLSYQALNKVPEARQAYETAIRWQKDSPVRSGAPYLDLGELLLDENELPAAVEALRQAARLSPNNPMAREQLGRAYQQAGDLQSARTELEKAAALAPKSSAVHFQLGQVYRRLGEKEKARAELELSAQLTSTHSSTETPNIDKAP
jgi:tetratricopeptide (TPR) repeat protein